METICSGRSLKEEGEEGGDGDGGKVAHDANANASATYATLEGHLSRKVVHFHFSQATVDQGRNETRAREQLHCCVI